MGLYSKYLFPRILDWAMRGEDMEEQRRLVLSEAKGEVFEIGFGTGLNLRHYPATVTRVTVADKNPAMHKIAQRRIAESPLEVEHHVMDGQELPLDDASFDNVVCTFTLCSIPDVSKALSELRRILRPGGKLLFIEHGLADDAKLQRWQHRLTPLQKMIGDGCRLNRNIGEIIRDARFRIAQLDNFYMPNEPRLFGYIYRGVAVKDA
ncbi:MAG: class I SAM-dependent methyltransferase [Candidatus Hydrogenedentales bacterium]